VPPISRSSWLYVESVYRDILTAYLGVSPFEFGASPLPEVASAEEPALAPQITARLALRGAPPSYSDIPAAVSSASVDALEKVRALVPGAVPTSRTSSAP